MCEILTTNLEFPHQLMAYFWTLFIFKQNVKKEIQRERERKGDILREKERYGGREKIREDKENDREREREKRKGEGVREKER